MSKRTEELEAEAEKLHARLQEISAEIRLIRENECPIKVGMVVRDKRDRTKLYRVAAIDRPEYGWVYANPKKADGSWGIAKRRLFDCEIVVQK